MLFSSVAVFHLISNTYGIYLISKEIKDTGCDPTESISTNEKCHTSALDILTAMNCLIFSGSAVSQVANCIESLTAAIASCRPAMSIIGRYIGSTLGDEQDITLEKKEIPRKIMRRNSIRSRFSFTKSTDPKSSGISDIEDGKEIKGILPKYEIDSSSKRGIVPKTVHGNILFEGVTFAYP